MKAIQMVVLLVSVLAASTAHGADLLTVYQQAQQNDATYLAAEQAYKAAEQNSPIARSALLPQVNLSASTTNDHTELK
ncbi:MAG: TolC family protein, partial [Gammaproteobacteria bacterium]